MTIVWKILNLKRQIDNDLVIDVTYECNITKEKSRDRKIGNITLTGDTESPTFIAFDDLTEEIVLDWVYNVLGDEKAEIETAIETKIDERVAKRAAKTTKRGLPWN